MGYCYQRTHNYADYFGGAYIRFVLLIKFSVAMDGVEEIVYALF